MPPEIRIPYLFGKKTEDIDKNQQHKNTFCDA
jgi:hypothetical protein